jgi:aminomethyltransferase
MVARPADPDQAGTLYIVVNAGTKEADFAAIAAAAGTSAILSRADQGGLFALQGPEAVAVLEGLVPGVAQLGFMTYRLFAWNGATLTIARSGYTGEDGFELLVEPAHAKPLWDALIADARVKPVGLGARDSLRLEAGLPLYGHDLDPSVSPVEGALNFALSKRRRAAADFPGAIRALRELGEGPARLRVGLLVEGAPAREGAAILDGFGNRIGVVTSGGFSPSLKRAIAMGFVPPAFGAPDTGLAVELRGRIQPARVVAMPFVPHRYFRQTK